MTQTEPVWCTIPAMELIPTADAMDGVAQHVLSLISERAVNGAVVVTLSGELGAGKTTFTQSLARKLGVPETVQSPTFVVMRRYELIHPRFDNLIHIDAYRLERVVEAEVLGIPALIEDAKNLMVIEWPERIETLIPNDALRITFAHGAHETRTVQYGE